ncbi:Thaumatin-like protein 1a, partial [Linum perenne]
IFVTDAGAEAAKVTFINKCPFTVWPATLSGGGVPQLPNTGFALQPKGSEIIEVPPNWSSGRFWGRTGCSVDATGKFTCLTGDCASGQVSCNGAGGIPPVTLAEFTLGGAGGLDFFDISLVDGFNLPVSITVKYCVGGGCKTTTCTKSINNVCPKELSSQCPQAYSYAFDDRSSTFTCPTGKDYIVTFCP